MRRRTLTACLGGLAFLFAGACAAQRVHRRGNDLLPREAAPGNPEVYVRASADAAALAVRLASALAEGGIVVHLAPSPLPSALERVYIVALGAAATDEVPGVAGRVAIAPPTVALLPGATQPLLLIRPTGAAPLEPTARPLWELHYAGLVDGFHLTREEEHSLSEAIVLWIRNRALDD